MITDESIKLIKMFISTKSKNKDQLTKTSYDKSCSFGGKIETYKSYTGN